jgi:hypothetical protein
MRVRITTSPLEPEVDGVRLDGFTVGTVRDVSTSLGSWLVAQGYADLEMRSSARLQDDPLAAPVGLPSFTDIDPHRSEE